MGLYHKKFLDSENKPQEGNLEARHAVPIPTSRVPSIPYDPFASYDPSSSGSSLTSSRASSPPQTPFLWLSGQNLVSSQGNVDNSAIYGCGECNTHFARATHVISKTFQGHTGRAWLFGEVINVNEGETMDRQMTTGLHTVRDISCANCGSTIGWKYEKSYEASQRYKEGKYILERALISEVN